MRPVPISQNVTKKKNKKVKNVSGDGEYLASLDYSSS